MSKYHKFSFIIFLFPFILYGCLSENPMMEEDLEIAIVGEHAFPEIGNVSFVNETLDSLYDSNKYYDVLFITESAFETASQDKYVSLFNSIDYPVFFYGLNGYRDYAFTKEGITLDMTKDENSSFVQGFVNSEDGSKKYWRFDLSDEQAKNNLDHQEMLFRIFDEVLH